MTRRAHIYALCLVFLLAGTHAVKLRGNPELHKETPAEAGAESAESAEHGLELAKNSKHEAGGEEATKGLTVEAGDKATDGKPLLTVSASDSPPEGSEVSDEHEQVGMILDADVEKCEDIRLEKACLGNSGCDWFSGSCTTKEDTASVDTDVGETVDDVNATSKELQEMEGNLARIEEEKHALELAISKDADCQKHSVDGKDQCPANECTWHENKCRSHDHADIDSKKERLAALEKDIAGLRKKIDSAKKDIDSNAKSVKSKTAADLEHAQEEAKRAEAKVHAAEERLKQLEDSYNEQDAKCKEHVKAGEKFNERCTEFDSGKCRVVEGDTGAPPECRANDDELKKAKEEVSRAKEDLVAALAAVQQVKSDIASEAAGEEEAGKDTASDAQRSISEDLDAKDAIREEEMNLRTEHCQKLESAACEKDPQCKLEDDICRAIPMEKAKDPGNDVRDRVDAFMASCSGHKEEAACKEADCEYDNGCKSPPRETIMAKFAAEKLEEMKKKCEAIKTDGGDEWTTACAAADGCKVEGEECTAEPITPNASVSEQAEKGLEEGFFDDMDESVRRCAACEAAVKDIRTVGNHFNKDINLLAHNGKILVDAKSICDSSHFLIVKDNELSKIFKTTEKCESSIGDLLKNAEFGKFISFGCTDAEECTAKNVCSSAEIGFCDMGESSATPKGGTFNHDEWAAAFEKASSTALSASSTTANTASDEKESLAAVERKEGEDVAKEEALEKDIAKDKEDVKAIEHEETTHTNDVDAHARTLVFLKDRLRKLAEESDGKAKEFVEKEKTSWQGKWEAIVKSVQDAALRQRLLSPIQGNQWPKKIEGAAAGDSEMGSGQDMGLSSDKKDVVVNTADTDDKGAAEKPAKAAEVAAPTSKDELDNKSLQQEKGQPPKGNDLESGAATDPNEAKKKEGEAAKEEKLCEAVTPVGDDGKGCHEKQCGYDLESKKCVTPATKEVCNEINASVAGKREKCKQEHCVWFTDETMDETHCISALEYPAKEEESEAIENKIGEVDAILRNDDVVEINDGEEHSSEKGAAKAGAKAGAGREVAGKEGAEKAGAEKGAKAPSADEIVNGLKGHKEAERSELVSTLVKELQDGALEKEVQHHLGSTAARAQAIVNILMSDPKVKKGVSKEMGWTKEEIEEAAEEAEKTETAKAQTPPAQPME